jgi:site-specific recombinase XerD
MPLTLTQALDRWYTSLEASPRIGSKRTIAAYRDGTARFLRHLPDPDMPLEDLTPEHIEFVLAELKRAGISPGGIAFVYRPVKTFLRWAVKRDLIAKSPCEIVDTPKVPVQPAPHVNEVEFRAMLAGTRARAKIDFRRRRDRAILLTLWWTGARLSEVAGLKVSDVDLQEGWAVFHGKGGKDRRVRLVEPVTEAIREYLTVRKVNAYSWHDALWLAPRGPLTANGIAQMVAERGNEAGLNRRVHPHLLRHSFVKRSLAAGMAETLVMAVTGHTTHAMLLRYGAANREEDAGLQLVAMARRAVA